MGRGSWRRDFDAKRVCKYDGCGKHVMRKGFCHVHAVEHMEKEEVDDYLKNRVYCKHFDCSKHAAVRGYCHRHAAGNVDEVVLNSYMERRRQLEKKRVCKVEGCNKHANLKGYCTQHARELIDNDEYRNVFEKRKNSKPKKDLVSLHDEVDHHFMSPVESATLGQNYQVPDADAVAVTPPHHSDQDPGISATLQYTAGHGDM